MGEIVKGGAEHYAWKKAEEGADESKFWEVFINDGAKNCASGDADEGADLIGKCLPAAFPRWIEVDRFECAAMQARQTLVSVPLTTFTAPRHKSRVRIGKK
jgi:hypothetical protein